MTKNKLLLLLVLLTMLSTRAVAQNDAIDEEGEFYRCQHCGWPFHYK